MKNIVVKKGGPYSVSGGVLTAGDVNAYRILIDMGTDASDMTAMAICQENGEFSADFDTNGSVIGVTLANSMYASEGYITVRFAVSENDSVLTAKEIVFRVVSPNNADTVAKTEGGTLSDILTAVSSCKESSQNALIISNQALALATTKADADSVYTKDETDSKIASVFKYRGSVDSWSQLPKGASIGDVYNIKSESTMKAYGVEIERVEDTGYGTYPEDEYINLYLSDASGFKIGAKIGVYTKDGKSIGEFTVQTVSGNTVSEQLIGGSGLYDVCTTIAEESLGDPNIFGMSFEIGSTYYFTGISATDTSIDIPLARPGDNVAWTGTSWDVLAGTVDLSGYATQDYVDSVIGKAMEGEY